MSRPSALRARSALVALGALCIATTSSASPAAAVPQSPGARQVTIVPHDRTVAVGAPVDVRGDVRGAAAGVRVALEHRAQGASWRLIAEGRTGAGGRFRLRAPAPGAGALRIVAAAPAARVATAGAQPVEPEPSAVAGIAIAADVVPLRRQLNVMAGRRASVRGTIRPAVPGARVALQRRSRHGWATVARGRTRAGGAFTLGARIRRPLSAAVRVRVAGSGAVQARGETIGRLNVYRRAMVSWYGPGFYGARLGCGGRLRADQLGVAHKSLPCGSKVTLRHGSRIVRVPVIDRGPYVGGREFDLTAATKRRLRFGGVGAILVTR